jgi:NTP pyrophosphatase (non-canonical NTP hydrolase)
MNKIEQYALAQLAKHGVDRYPTAGRQFFKLVEEVGELSKEINKGWRDDDADQSKIRREIADVAISLFNLARKLYVDVEEAVKELVDEDVRKFTDDESG